MLGVVEDVDEFGFSANERRWMSLLEVAGLILDKGISCEQLIVMQQSQKEKPTTSSEGHCHDFVGIDRILMNKGKRSSRKKKVFLKPLEDAGHGTASTSRTRISAAEDLKLTFKMSSTVIWPQGGCSSSKKIAIKKPTGVPKNLDDQGTRKRKTEEGAKDQVRAKKIRPTVVSKLPVPAPILPEEIKNRILEVGGSLESVVFVIEKRLFKTDVSRYHGRLSIPYSQVNKEFLTPEEAGHLGVPKAAILASLIEPSLQERVISFRDWKANSQYAFVTTWNDVLRANGLKEGMSIRLWSFRKKEEDSKLCFALVPVDD